MSLMTVCCRCGLHLLSAAVYSALRQPAQVFSDWSNDLSKLYHGEVFTCLLDKMIKDFVFLADT